MGRVHTGGSGAARIRRAITAPGPSSKVPPQGIQAGKRVDLFMAFDVEGKGVQTGLVDLEAVTPETGLRLPYVDGGVVLRMHVCVRRECAGA